MGCWAQRCCLAWRREQAAQARPPLPHVSCLLGQHRTLSLSQALRQARPQAAGVLPPMPPGSPVCGRVWLGHHLACEAIVVAPGSGSGVAGVMPTTVLTPPRPPGAGVVSPRARAGRGRVAPVLCQGLVGVSCPAWGRVAESSGGGRGRRARHASAAPRQQQGASRCRVVMPGMGRPRALHCGAWCRVRRAIAQGPPGVAACGSQGGVRWGDGGRSLGGQGARVSLQPPNKGVQATAASVRSCLAPAARRA